MVIFFALRLCNFQREEIGLETAYVGCMLGSRWVFTDTGSILGRLEAIWGLFWVIFFALKTMYIIFSAKKLGLKPPMLDSCWGIFFAR